MIDQGAKPTELNSGDDLYIKRANRHHPNGLIDGSITSAGQRRSCCLETEARLGIQEGSRWPGSTQRPPVHFFLPRWGDVFQTLRTTNTAEKAFWTTRARTGRGSPERLRPGAESPAEGSFLLQTTSRHFTILKPRSK